MKKFLVYLIVAIFFSCLIMQAATAANITADSMKNLTPLLKNPNPGVNNAFYTAADWRPLTKADIDRFTGDNRIKRKFPGAFKLTN